MLALICAHVYCDNTIDTANTLNLPDIIEGCTNFTILESDYVFPLEINVPLCLAVDNAFVLGYNLHMIAAFYENQKYRVTKESSNFIGVSTECPDKYCVYNNKTLIKVWTLEQDETASIFLINQSTVITTVSTDNTTNSTVTEDVEYNHYYSTYVNDSLKLKFSRLVLRETNNTFKVTTHIKSITLLGNFNITATFKNNDGIISQQYNKYTNGTISYTDERGSFPTGPYGYYSVDSTKRVDYSTFKLRGADLESASADLLWVKPATASVFTSFHGMIPTDSMIFKKSDLRSPGFPLAVIGIIIALIILISVITIMILLIYFGVGPCLQKCPYFGSYKNMSLENASAEAEASYIKVVE